MYPLYVRRCKATSVHIRMYLECKQFQSCVIKTATLRFCRNRVTRFTTCQSFLLYSLILWVPLSPSLWSIQWTTAVVTWLVQTVPQTLFVVGVTTSDRLAWVCALREDLTDPRTPRSATLTSGTSTLAPVSTDVCTSCALQPHACYVHVCTCTCIHTYASGTHMYVSRHTRTYTLYHASLTWATSS